MTFHKCLQFVFAARLIEIKLKSQYGLVLFSIVLFIVKAAF